MLSDRPLRERLALVLVLPFVAGYVNGTGIYVVGTYTSHVTGHTAQLGDRLAEGDFTRALGHLGLILAFLLGAVVASALVDGGQVIGRGRYGAALLIEIAALSAYALLSQDPESVRLSALLLSGAMGLQNALVTRISGAVVRTTHLTGVVTDIGIEASRIARWAWRRMAQVVAPGIAGPAVAVEAKRLRLHLSIFSAFSLGAVAGPILHLRAGRLSLAVPIVALALVALVDVVVGLGPPRLEAKPEPDPAQRSR